MSLQSESDRVDYSKSDHAPKGTRMAGDVIDYSGGSPLEKLVLIAADAFNKAAIRDKSTPVDETNVDLSFLKKKLGK